MPLPAPPPADLTGGVYGRLTAVRATADRNTGGNVVWECGCACGRTVRAASATLV